MVFALPGEISQSSPLFAREGQAVSLTLEGKKVAEALDKFMANGDALAATFRAGKDLPDNDDLMLQTMFGMKGPVEVKVKLPPDSKPQFDYKTEEKVAEIGQAEMLKQAGVDLIPKFIVKPATTQK